MNVYVLLGRECFISNEFSHSHTYPKKYIQHSKLECKRKFKIIKLFRKFIIVLSLVDLQYLSFDLFFLLFSISYQEKSGAKFLRLDPQTSIIYF